MGKRLPLRKSGGLPCSRRRGGVLGGRRDKGGRGVKRIMSVMWMEGRESGRSLTSLIVGYIFLNGTFMGSRVSFVGIDE